MSPSRLNPALTDLGAYASKQISEAAKRDPGVINLSIGEPRFGPPEAVLRGIEAEDLSLAAFVASVKTYETSRGCPRLRQAIADWYARRHDLQVDPEREILVTHGGVEAFALALLACTAPGDGVAFTDPSYMLYDRAVRTLGRRAVRFARPVAEREFAALIDADADFRERLGGARALVVNSPENPTGYVVARDEWARLVALAERHDAWLIHDEVYDSMAHARPHVPARALDRLGERCVLANSCSKKFGMPGLRIGWLVAHADMIEQAAKAHDYLLLGVNRQSEQVALRVLQDPGTDGWLHAQTDRIAGRARRAMSVLGPAQGFAWPRRPMGGMFLFPDVSGLAMHCPPDRARTSAGDTVARHLLQHAGVATVPGSVYGDNVAHHLRLVLCSDEADFDAALHRLGHVVGCA